MLMHWAPNAPSPSAMLHYLKHNARQLPNVIPAFIAVAQRAARLTLSDGWIPVTSPGMTIVRGQPHSLIQTPSASESPFVRITPRR